MRVEFIFDAFFQQTNVHARRRGDRHQFGVRFVQPVIVGVVRDVATLDHLESPTLHCHVRSPFVGVCGWSKRDDEIQHGGGDPIQDHPPIVNSGVRIRDGGTDRQHDHHGWKKLCRFHGFTPLITSAKRGQK